MAREMVAPTTAAVAIAVIGLNIHFGFTGLLNMGQAGFMLLGAYGFAISIVEGAAAAGGGPDRFRRGAGVRADPRRPDPEAARRLPRDRDHLGGGDHPVHRTIVGPHRLHRRRPGHPRLVSTATRSRPSRSSATGRPTSVSWTTPTPASTAGGCGSSPGPWSPSARCVVYLLVRSPWGRLLRGIREDEDAIRSLGKNVFAIKMQALIIGGLLGALGGMIYVLPGSVQADAHGPLADVLLLHRAADRRSRHDLRPDPGLDHLLHRPASS